MLAPKSVESWLRKSEVWPGTKKTVRMRMKRKRIQQGEKKRWQTQSDSVKKD